MEINIRTSCDENETAKPFSRIRVENAETGEEISAHSLHLEAYPDSIVKAYVGIYPTNLNIENVEGVLYTEYKGQEYKLVPVEKEKRDDKE